MSTSIDKENSVENRSIPDFNFKPIIIDGEKISHFKIFSNDKKEARQIFVNKINKLFQDTYDNYRFIVPEKTQNVYVGIVDVISKELAGIMIIIRKQCRNTIHGEFGGSAVSKKFRGKHIQSFCVKAGAPYILNLLMSEIPIFSEPRCFTFHSQLQCYNAQLPNNKGKVVPIGIPRGFYLAYILEKDNQGEYILDNVIMIDAWDTLDEIVSKKIYLPLRTLEKEFQIFNPLFRKDNIPEYVFPLLKKGKDEKKIVEIHEYKGDPIIYPENDYKLKEWNWLIDYIQLYSIGEEESELKSQTDLFSYVDVASPSKEIQSIHIEHINSWNFIDDISSVMKVINIGIIISDFENINQKAANIVLMDILIKEKFIPSAVFDVKCVNRRIRVANFVRVKDIKLEAKFELLDKYKPTFDIFIHDCKKQGISWPKVVNVIEVEKLLTKNNLITLDSDFNFTPKGSCLNELLNPIDNIEFDLNDKKLFSKLHTYIKKTNKNINIFMHTEKFELDLERIKKLESAFDQIPEYINKINNYYISQNHSMILDGNKFSISINDKK